MSDPSIAQFMNRDVLRGTATTPLREIVSQMKQHVQSALVVCDEGYPIGVVSERDLIEVLDAAIDGLDLDTVTAADIMATPVHTLPESATAAEVARVMKECSFRRVPIVDDKNELSGIVNLLELQGAMNAALEKRGQDLEEAVLARTAELQGANAKLEQLSLRDGLTGLLNRRAMNQKLDEMHALTQRYGNIYSVVLVDIDHFKALNDAGGHLYGDSVLKTIARTMSESVRLSDSVYRYGGEEFLIILPETTLEGGELIAERVRLAIESLAIAHPKSSPYECVTVSCGYVVSPPEDEARMESWERTVERADRLLYRAKKSGRNCSIGPNSAN